MKPIVFGAVLGLLWLALGMPYPPVTTVLPALLQPVVLGFAAGLIARPHLARRWPT